jgi:predicted ATPase
VRIAVSGTHGVGKSTLVADLVRALPGHVAIAEPYLQLLDEGHAFADPPSLEDYEVQLERSLASLASPGLEAAVFERCPADFLAYIAAHADGDGLDLAAWLPRVRVALAAVDLVVFVPLERPGRGFRSRVDERLHEILLDDVHGLGVEVLEVRGEPGQRLDRVLDRISRKR